MRYLVTTCLTILACCSPIESGSELLKYEGGQDFAVDLQKIDKDLCVSDFFLNGGKTSSGQSIELFDSSGNMPMHNMGDGFDSGPASFRRLSKNTSYKINSQYILKENERYRARLNIIAFKCNNLSNKYLYHSFVHSSTYGPPAIEYINIKSKWISFEFKSS